MQLIAFSLSLVLTQQLKKRSFHSNKQMCWLHHFSDSETVSLGTMEREEINYGIWFWRLGTPRAWHQPMVWNFELCHNMGEETVSVYVTERE